MSLLKVTLRHLERLVVNAPPSRKGSRHWRRRIDVPAEESDREVGVEHRFDHDVARSLRGVGKRLGEDLQRPDDAAAFRTPKFAINPPSISSRHVRSARPLINATRDEFDTQVLAKLQNDAATAG
ncbi:hypothetical protein FP2506_17204 [Fulvimarina pelagi HTCC2506]|uniref:Uncharacterized protein n=1 Tax=Fulvimarina pelagi HTCC2506 TaxID=314231 RepID=Q0G2I9_9HYPH|nr:hypothetical protein FP2506_17204 [Fulvimarina pelagi HTCC2506]